MSLKVLIDVNLSPEWVTALASKGWEALHWSAVGNVGAPDAVVMGWAKYNRYLVFTHDLDFGTALALTRAEAPSVVQIRGRLVLPEQAGDLIFAVLARYRDELETGALVVVDEAKSRVRILPL